MNQDNNYKIGDLVIVVDEQSDFYGVSGEIMNVIDKNKYSIAFERTLYLITFRDEQISYINNKTQTSSIKEL